MTSAKFKICYNLTLVIALVTAIAATGGILLEGLYRDSELYETAWIANDIVTLIIVLPLLIAALFFSQKGSQRAQLVWMGLLGYLFYNYAFYLFGAAFNWFFLLYVALFSASAYALIMGLAALDVRSISKNFQPQTPRRWICIYLLFISLPLGFFETTQCLNFIISGKLPEVPTLIFALDLAIVVPNTALASILLWKYHPWGYVLSIIMLVKAFTYGLVLSLTTTLLVINGLTSSWDPLMPFYVFVMTGGLIGSLVLLKNLKPGSQDQKNKIQVPVAVSY